MRNLTSPPIIIIGKDRIPRRNGAEIMRMGTKNSFSMAIISFQIFTKIWRFTVILWWGFDHRTRQDVVVYLLIIIVYLCYNIPLTSWGSPVQVGIVPQALKLKGFRAFVFVWYFCKRGALETNENLCNAWNRWFAMGWRHNWQPKRNHQPILFSIFTAFLCFIMPSCRAVA